MPLCISLSTFPTQLSCSERTGRTLRHAFGIEKLKGWSKPAAWTEHDAVDLQACRKERPSSYSHRICPRSVWHQWPGHARWPTQADICEPGQCSPSSRYVGLWRHSECWPRSLSASHEPALRQDKAAAATVGGSSPCAYPPSNLNYPAVLGFLKP